MTLEEHDAILERQWTTPITDEHRRLWCGIMFGMRPGRVPNVSRGYVVEKVDFCFRCTGLGELMNGMDGFNFTAYCTALTSAGMVL